MAPEVQLEPPPTRKRYYDEKEFNQIIVRGDGHCIVNAVLVGLRQQRKNTPTTTMLLDQLQIKFKNNLEKYGAAIRDDTDPIQEMEQYVHTKKYNTAFTDIIFPILADILDIDINILYQQKSEKRYEWRGDNYTFSPTVKNGDREEVFVVYVGDHYNALIFRKSKRNLDEKQQPSEDDLSKLESSTKQKPGTPPLAKEKKAALEDKSKPTKIDEKLYCTCQKPYNHDKHECMIPCDVCEEWFHNDCIEKFACNKCRVDHDESEYYKNRYEVKKEQNEIKKS